MTPPPRILEFQDGLAAAFREINTEWITRMYALEEADRRVLDDPRGQIVDPGGAILFAELEGLGVVGCCALMRMGGQSIELAKMGVLERARGAKVGEALLAAAIARAAEMGADPLFLLTNRRSQAAIHLYEKRGFVHDAGIMAAYGAEFARCDVAMRYTGSPPA